MVAVRKKYPFTSKRSKSDLESAGYNKLGFPKHCFYSTHALRTSRAKGKYLTWQKDCAGRDVLFLLHWQITGDQALKLRSLVVWTHEFKVVGPWELCGSLPASGLSTPSNGSLGYLLWKYMKQKFPTQQMTARPLSICLGSRVANLLIFSRGISLWGNLGCTKHLPNPFLISWLFFFLPLFSSAV